MIPLLFMVPSTWNIFHLLSSPSLPSEILVVLLLGSGVTCWAKGLSWIPPAPVAPPSLHYSHCVDIICLFSQPARGFPEGWDFI